MLFPFKIGALEASHTFVGFEPFCTCILFAFLPIVAERYSVIDFAWRKRQMAIVRSEFIVVFYTPIEKIVKCFNVLEFSSAQELTFYSSVDHFYRRI